jgi:tryptophan synthase alpha chain
MGTSRISIPFRQRKEEGRKCLIINLCAGDPSWEDASSIARELVGAGADMIVLGVPFSDPVDGSVIQAAFGRALAAGTDLAGIIGLVGKLKSQVQVPLLLMSYYNPLLQYGLKSLASDLQNAGGDGLIVPDLPWEESPPLKNKLEETGLALVPLVAPNTGEERLEKICSTAGGFVYCLSPHGTGEDRECGLMEYLTKVARFTRLPVVIGFGFDTEAHVQARSLSPLWDGVIVENQVIRVLHEEGLDAAVKLVQSLRGFF